MNKLDNNRKLNYLHIAVIVIGAIFISLSIFHTNLWFDESYSVEIAKHSFSEIWSIGSNDVHPILYYFVLHIAGMITNYNIMALRVMSFIPLVILGILKVQDMNKASSEQVVQKVLTNRKFNQVKVDTSNANIKVKQGNHYRVLFEGRHKLLPKVEVKNKQLIVEDKDGIKVVNGNLFDLFKKHSVVPQITIELPDEKLKNIEIDDSNGSVTVQGIAVSQGEIDLSNDNIMVDHSTADGYDLDTSNGHVEINGSNKGDSYSKNDKAQRVLSIDNSNGDITVSYGG